MVLVVCVDDKMGMLFNGRRQSKDRLLRADLLQLTEGRQLWMNSYSATQFDEVAAHICVDESFLDKADTDDYCFVENTDIAPYADRVTGVLIYRWNRSYPGDAFFPLELFENRWHLLSREEFSGSSHDTVTREVYKL